MTTVYALFLIYSMAHLAQQPVIDGDIDRLTMANSSKFFSKSYYSNMLINSFKVFLASTCLFIVTRVPLAYVLSLYKIKGKSLLNILIIVVSMSAPFIGAYSQILLLGWNGVITIFFKNIGIIILDTCGFGGIILVMTLQLFPPVFLYVEGALKNIDNSLLGALSNLRCPGPKRFFKVVVPLIMPTLLAAALLVFMRSFADFGTPMPIGEGYCTSPVVFYTEFTNEVGGNDGFTAVIAVIATVVATVVFSAQKYVSNRNSFPLNALHPMEEEEAKDPVKILACLAAYVIVGITILPQVYMTYTSFKSTEGRMLVSGYSPPSHVSVFGKLGWSIQDTLIILIYALVIIMLLAVLVVYLVVRRKDVLANTVSITSMTSYIVPGAVLNITLLIGLNKRPTLLSDTMLIMVMVLIIQRLPYTIRSSVVILQQMPMSIKEAITSLGASRMKSLFKVIVPMMTSGIVVGTILSWAIMISELSTAITLYTDKAKTLVVAVYMEVVRGNHGVAAALSIMLAVLMTAPPLIFNKVNGDKDLSL